MPACAGFDDCEAVGGAEELGAIGGGRVAWDEAFEEAGTGAGVGGKADGTDGDFTAVGGRGGAAAADVLACGLGAGTAWDRGTLMLLLEGKLGAGAAMGCVGAVGIFSLILVGWSPAFAYAGIENGSGRSANSLRKYSCGPDKMNT